MTDRMYAFGAATLALLASVMQGVYAANASGTYRLGGMVWLYLLLYVAYTLMWTVSLFLRFNRTGNAA